MVVIAVVDVEALVPYLDDLVDRDVEKIAVVGDEDVAEGIGLEVVLEPVARFEIEMVGRLVQQEQVRLGEQQFRQRNTHLPAAGELLRLTRPVLLAEPKTVEHRTYLGVECITI